MDVLSKVNGVLDFIVEIEKLKGVLRKSRPVGLKRYENSAEHSWHVCLSALMLKDFANEAVDVNRVIKMLLVHDLGEIDAGDKIVYASETPEQKMSEREGISRIVKLLPSEMADDIVSLRDEFEAGISSESKFAKAIDRVPPLLHNIHDDGHGWRENSISKEQVFALNSERISAGSTQLWQAVEQKLQSSVKKGDLV